MREKTISYGFTLFIFVGIITVGWMFSVSPPMADAQSALNTSRNPLSYELAFGSISGTGPSGATGLVTTTTSCALVAFTNTTNVEIDTLIGPSGTKHRVAAGTFQELNLGAANTRWPSGTIIKAYGAGTAPGSGAFELLCQPY